MTKPGKAEDGSECKCPCHGYERPGIHFTGCCSNQGPNEIAGLRYSGERVVGEVRLPPATLEAYERMMRDSAVWFKAGDVPEPEADTPAVPFVEPPLNISTDKEGRIWKDGKIVGRVPPACDTPAVVPSQEPR